VTSVSLNITVFFILKREETFLKGSHIVMSCYSFIICYTNKVLE